MSDPFKIEENTLPVPDAEFAGLGRKDSFGKRAFSAVAKLWRPRGTSMEPAAATVSRYAMRLIDRKTGKAYAADELSGAGLGLPAGGAAGDLLLRDGSGGATWGQQSQLQAVLASRDVVVNPGRLLKFWVDAQDLSAADPDGKYITVLGTGDSIGTGSGPLPPLCSLWAQRWGVGAMVSSSFGTWDAVCNQFNSPAGPTQTTGTVVAYGLGGTITPTNQPGNFTYLPNGRFWRVSAGATVTEVPRDSMRRTGWRKIRCFYGKKTGGGTLTFDAKLNGSTISGGTKVVDTSVGAGTNDFGWVDFEPGDGLGRNGALSLVVSGSVADADYLGSIVYLESGIVPLLFGLGGGTLVSQGSVPAANWAKFAEAVDASLVLFAIKGGTVEHVEGRFELMEEQIPKVSVLALGNFDSQTNLSVPGQDDAMRDAIRRCALQYGTAYVDERELLESYQAIIDQGLTGGDGVHFNQAVWRLRAEWIDHHVLGITPVGSFLVPETAAADRPVTWRDLEKVLTTWSPRICTLGNDMSSSVAANYTLDRTNGHLRFSWNTSVANPSTAGVVWAHPCRLQGTNSWVSQFSLTEAIGDVDMKLRMGWGYNSYPTDPLSGHGWVWNLGYDSLAGNGTPWIQFEVHTGSALYTSPKFYLPVGTGARGYRNGSPYPHQWVVRYDGAGANYTTKRMRCWMMPGEQTSAASTEFEMPQLVADWTFTPASPLWGASLEGYGTFNVSCTGALAAGGSAQLNSVTFGPPPRLDLLGRP